MFDAGYMKMRDWIYYETCVELIWPLDFFYSVKGKPNSWEQMKDQMFYHRRDFHERQFIAGTKFKSGAA